VSASSLLAAGDARAQAEQRERQSWFEGPHLTEDWGGLRPALAARGIYPYARYLAGVWSDVDGGLDTGARYTGFAQFGVVAELEPLLGWSGATFHLGLNAFHGGQPSKALVGTAPSATVTSWEAKDHVRFFNITLTQRAFDDTLEVKGGLMAIDDDFPTSRSIDVFANGVFAAFTSGRGNSQPPFYPVPGPGLLVTATPSEAWTLRLGVYTSDAGSDEWSNLGFDASLHDGAMLIGEVATHRTLLGLRGDYVVGASFTDQAVQKVEGARSEQDAWSVDWRVDQQLWVAEHGDSTVSAVARFGISPGQDAVLVEAYAVAGLAWFGPLPGRKDDVLAAGFAWSHFGSKYLKQRRANGTRVTQREWDIELTYRVQVTPWLQVQPDLQVILDPLEARSNAVVLGLQVLLTL